MSSLGTLLFSAGRQAKSLPVCGFFGADSSPRFLFRTLPMARTSAGSQGKIRRPDRQKDGERSESVGQIGEISQGRKRRRRKWVYGAL